MRPLFFAFWLQQVLTCAWPWKPMQNVSIESAARGSFKEPFIIRKLPAFAVFKSGRWWGTRQIEKACASSSMKVGQRLLPGLQSFLSEYGEQFKQSMDTVLQRRHGVGLDELLSLYYRRWNIAQYLNYTKSNFKENRSLCASSPGGCFHPTIASETEIANPELVADFLASYLVPITIHDLEWPERLCAEFGKDLRPSLHADGQRPNTRFFFNPPHSRSYPAHDHGSSSTHVLGLVLDGQKSIVAWAPKEAHKLYPMSTLAFDGDAREAAIFFAEGIFPDTKKQPGLLVTNGVEALLETGDLFFLPKHYVHQLEARGPSSAMQLVWLPETEESLRRQIELLTGSAVDEL